MTKLCMERGVMFCIVKKVNKKGSNGEKALKKITSHSINQARKGADYKTGCSEYLIRSDLENVIEQNSQTY